MKKEAFTCLESEVDEVDILAPGCGLAPETPLKNLKALVEARNEFCGRR
ncbi:uroporphyrinogen decarboxylase family protein [Methanosarcina siciliae]|nr:uroporphyrinogen decarboxylase family protein [Methanosarcina siciliae]